METFFFIIYKPLDVTYESCNQFTLSKNYALNSGLRTEG